MFNRIINFFRKRQKCDHIFVYGTLRREFVYMNHMANKLAKSSIFINNATLFNHGFYIHRDCLGAPVYPIAVESKQHMINGQICRLKKQGNIIEELDNYEGEMYTRKVLKINDLQCYVYVINSDYNELSSLGEIKGGNWLNYHPTFYSVINIYN